MYLEKCINYSLVPVEVSYRKFVYLYETTNKLNGDIYIGVRVFNGSNPYNDSYIGNGCKILKDGRLYKRRGKETNFRRALSKYGFLNFEKKIICFFSNVDDALNSEENIVDEEFLKRSDTLNMAIGGGFPPIGEGENNNNYGKHWTDEMKEKLSNKRKKNGKSKGGKNPKAIKCYVYDLWKEEWLKLDFMHQLNEIDKDVNRCGINKIRKFRWLIVSEKLNSKDIPNFVKENLHEKYQKTFNILQLIKQGKSVEDIVNLGFLKAHAIRLLNKYGKSN